jgi:F-type H+-transporting ATPase subunit k
MGFIGAYVALGVWSTSGSSKPKPVEPPIKAASGDEEAFIKEFLAKAESEDKQ